MNLKHVADSRIHKKPLIHGNDDYSDFCRSVHIMYELQEVNVLAQPVCIVYVCNLTSIQESPIFEELLWIHVFGNHHKINA